MTAEVQHNFGFVFFPKSFTYFYLCKNELQLNTSRINGNEYMGS